METILVIEDKESMAEMLKETLESEGYSGHLCQRRDRRHKTSERRQG